MGHKIRRRIRVRLPFLSFHLSFSKIIMGDNLKFIPEFFEQSAQEIIKARDESLSKYLGQP